MRSTISQLGELCSGCGACLGVCPNQAIDPATRNGIVSISKRAEACTNCNLCIKVCPVLTYAFSETNPPTHDETIGKLVKAFLSHATDDRVRSNGASGGVITALLRFMLKEKIIDGVLATKTEGRTYRSYIAKTEKDILASQGSTYFPTFGLRHLRELLKTHKRCVVVGLPCQIDALRIAQNTFHNFEEKVCISFGLFCFHVNEPWYLDYVIRRICKVQPRNVSEITARKGGWPGNIIVSSFDRNEAISYSRFWYPLPLYHFTSPLGCLYCANRLNVHADLSFGDAWMDEIVRSDNLGSSIVIARTAKGLSLLEEVQDHGILYLEKIEEKDILNAQPTLEQQSGVSTRRSKIRGQLPPFSNIDSLEVLDALLPTFHASISRNEITRRIIFNMPFSLARMYCRLCGLIHRNS